MRKIKNEGFTLIEVVVVMAIIAVLAVLVVGAITIARNTAKETANRSNARTIQVAQEAYYSSHGEYLAMEQPLDMAKTDLGVNLASGACSNSVTSDDGGNIVATTSGYDIYVANKNCNASKNDSTTYIDVISSE